MRPTSRFWALAALAAAAGGWAVVVGRPVLLAGVCGVCAWLLAQQYRFVAALRTVSGALELTQSSSASRTVTGASTFLTVTARVDPAHSLTLRVDPEAPVGADGAVEPLWLDGRATETTGTYEFEWPVAGTFRVGAPTVTARDRLGLFEQRVVPDAPTPTVAVEPRRPRTVHVGEGGDPIAAGFGDHDAGRSGRGLEPAEVRRYVAGDAFRRIDWKATARLNETHVREFTARTERETQLFVDHRATMATGAPGQTKLDYARHVALAFVDQAGESADRVGCETVGDEGVTGVFEPRADLDHLRAIRRHLDALDPGDDADQRPEPTSTTGEASSPTPTAPDRVRATRQRLDGDESAFAARLRPFFDRPDAYVRAISDRPLYRAVEAAATGAGALWTVVVTDDANRTELREAVKVARGRGPVLVFLTPTPLFEPGGLDDLDAAYDAYVDFEEFRRELAALPEVSAFEVGPADRLSTVLAEAPGEDRARQRRGR
ncbi:DUF58 domain-containing protein [Halosimplex halophilum]|uniref:DUF58 domain-containing protein n=1 Tax=Halosimplex halophilum TaxID=2559572 RepID=UPI0014355605|nr:DUF58 domain-containing protein [Halosimplex halophilum]